MRAYLLRYHIKNIIKAHRTVKVWPQEGQNTGHLLVHKKAGSSQTAASK